MMDLFEMYIVYATPEKCYNYKAQAREGDTVANTIAKNPPPDDFPIQDVMHANLGVFGKKIDKLTYLVQKGDRVEIYRPLVTNFRKMRQRRILLAK